MIGNLRWRIGRLESSAESANRRIVYIWLNHDETDEAANARWLRKNPGESLDDAGVVAYLIRWAGADEGTTH